jgi:XTP/dITP diphosphohydrolase
VEGSVDGTLLRQPRGDGGFGYDPIFVPTGLDRSFAEMPGAQKDAMSHRGQALERLAQILGELLA